MKHKIIKLFILFLTTYVLSSQKEYAGGNNDNPSFNVEHSCLDARSGYAENITCRQAPSVQKKNDDADIIPVTDNEISLSPISRFILLQ